MIERVEQTPFQQMEATSPDSLARKMLAVLMWEERRTWRELQAQLVAHKCERDSEVVGMASVRWLQARRGAEKARRILYGWEQ